MEGTSRQSGRQKMGQTLPGLDGFYMAGQWTVPYAGMPISAMTGCDGIQLGYTKDRKPFVTQQPA